MQRSQLISVLEREMATNTGWVRIHAAEGLLEGGRSKPVAESFRPEAETVRTPYRIGAWRVLAQATTGAERDSFIARIRETFNDAQASDRISAAESLGKLDAANRSDRGVIRDWLKTADDATAAFPRWLLALSSTVHERREDEDALSGLLGSTDAVARLRAAFALGRLKTVSTDSIARLRQRLKVEPPDSIARVYLLSALYLHAKDAAASSELEQQLMCYENGRPNEQLELGIAIGRRRRPGAAKLLAPMLSSPEADGRIGAATGILYFIQ